MKNKFVISLSILGLMFVSVFAFASNLTERNVYGIVSDNFTGALETCGESIDNICFYTWADWWADDGKGGNILAPQSELVYDGSAKEGKTYKKFECLGPSGAGSWSGFAYAFVEGDNTTKKENGVDIRHFRYLDFWIRKVEGNIRELSIGMEEYNGSKGLVSLADLNISSTTTNWQHVVIDLNTLGVDLSKIALPFEVICDNLSGNTTFHIDNLVLRTDNSSATFNINLKSVEDMDNPEANPTQIKWDDSSVWRNSWQASKQYIELDADVYSCSWKVRMWVNNGAKGRNGLYGTLNGKDYVIPMCWRVFDGTLVNLVNTDKATYLIGHDSNYNLYDRGKTKDSNPNYDNTKYFPWLYMKEYKDINFNKPEDLDYITVWDSSLGYHGYSAANVGEGFYEFSKSVKKPKIYFGADFDQAAGGLNYTANVVVELSYE